MRSCKSIAFPSVALMPFHREFRDVFEGLFDDFYPTTEQTKSNSFVPSFNLERSAEGLLLTADLPGLTEQDINLQVVDNQLIISGERAKDYEDKKDNYYYIERNYGSFKRTVNLGKEYDADKVSAELNNGVLKVKIPKKADACDCKTRKIEISCCK